MSSGQQSLPIWLIAVIAGGGGFILLALVAAIIRWHRRRRRQRVYEDDEFGPTRQLAIRRGRVVPAAWNMSIGHSILGMRTHNDSFASLDDNLSGTGRRSIRSVFKKRSSRLSSMTSQTSRPNMLETRKSALAVPATRAENQELLQDVDNAFVLRSPMPAVSRSSTAKSSYSLPSIVNGRELSQDIYGTRGSTATQADSPSPLQESLPATGEARISSASKKASSHSAPKSKYHKQSSSKGRGPPSPRPPRYSRNSKLAAVVEDSTPSPGAGFLEPTPAIPRRKGSIKRNLKPLAVPAPVLSSATPTAKRTSKVFPANSSSIIPPSPKRGPSSIPSPQSSPQRPLPPLPLQEPPPIPQHPSPPVATPFLPEPSFAVTPWEWQDPPPRRRKYTDLTEPPDAIASQLSSSIHAAALSHRP